MMAKRRRDEMKSITATMMSIIRMRKRHLLPLQHADLLGQVKAEAARAHDADDGGLAGVGFEVIEQLARQHRQHLRQHAEAHRFHG